MKRKIFSIFTIFLFVFLISQISASVSCTPSVVSINYQQNENKNSSIFCTNIDTNSTVTLSDTSSYFSLSETTIGQAPSSKTITLIFDPNAPVGTNTGQINFNDGSSSVPVVFIVDSPQPTSSCNINIFPTLLSNIKVQQGQIKTRTVQLSVPSCYPSPVDINGLALASDEKPLQLGELTLGQIQPGNSLTIPIEINAEGVSVGQYNDVLQILAYNSSGNNIPLPSVSISVLVSAGISPLTNFSLDEVPSCSLSSNELASNQTYTFTCTKNNPNIDIKTENDNLYIQGINVQPSSTQWIYTFKAKKVGNTIFRAIFSYQGFSVGNPFEKEVKISPSGASPSSGTTMKVVFYQGGKKVSNLTNTETTIQVIDNKTNNLILSPSIYLDGILINSSINMTEGEHDLRISNIGYLDNVFNFTVTKKLQEIKISVLAMTPNDFNDWKKGEDVLVTLSKKSDWKVEFRKFDKQGNVLVTPSILNQGNGTDIDFSLDEFGQYSLVADGSVVFSKLVESQGFFSRTGVQVAGAIFLIFVVVIVFARFKKPSEEDDIPGAG